jgi:hypothetical protein
MGEETLPMTADPVNEQNEIENTQPVEASHLIEEEFAKDELSVGVIPIMEETLLDDPHPNLVWGDDIVDAAEGPSPDEEEILEDMHSSKEEVLTSSVDEKDIDDVDETNLPNGQETVELADFNVQDEVPDEVVESMPVSEPKQTMEVEVDSTPVTAPQTQWMEEATPVAIEPGNLVVNEEEHQQVVREAENKENIEDDNHYTEEEIVEEDYVGEEAHNSDDYIMEEVVDEDIYEEEVVYDEYEEEEILEEVI